VDVAIGVRLIQDGGNRTVMTKQSVAVSLSAVRLKDWSIAPTHCRRCRLIVVVCDEIITERSDVCLGRDDVSNDE
jgi:hypothetical protein